MNYHTGIEWGTQSEFTECIPYSNLQIGLLFRPESGFVIKNEVSSRKKITFAHRQRDVLLYELINSDLMLAKLNDNDQTKDADKSFGNTGRVQGKGSYWTMMDTFGDI